MLIRLFMFVMLALVLGCTSSQTPAVPDGLSSDQLVAAIDEIAETGRFEEETLVELTIGLENAGLMGEAASAQQLPTMTDERQIKQFAKRLSATVKKGLASNGAK
ncbi:hypothetical protein C5Y96_11345 [Blastopirellula marina]|uniref:Uncharacterized protein n=1 Tax=Blastopirellula marina TaxID=124 RepID=A0A2S8FMP8_9BACT|nr:MULTISPECIES: hypothetical protein [Pirellulaceae]PQO33431.1 hypothetical protein C5Y96_11345 [Blastopirellula marina]RCS52521.1 hypothetical protein DTL36_11355 [Bremerella cremea]